MSPSKKIAKQKMFEAISLATMFGIEMLNADGPDAELERITEELTKLFKEVKNLRWDSK